MVLLCRNTVSLLYLWFAHTASMACLEGVCSRISTGCSLFHLFSVLVALVQLCVCVCVCVCVWVFYLFLIYIYMKKNVLQGGNT